MKAIASGALIDQTQLSRKLDDGRDQGFFRERMIPRLSFSSRVQRRVFPRGFPRLEGQKAFPGPGHQFEIGRCAMSGEAGDLGVDILPLLDLLGAERIPEIGGDAGAIRRGELVEVLQIGGITEQGCCVHLASFVAPQVLLYANRVGDAGFAQADRSQRICDFPLLRLVLAVRFGRA